MDEDTPTPAPLFRPTKRRKVWRKRPESEDEEDQTVPPIPSKQPADTMERSASVPLPVSELSMAEVLKKRKQGQARRAGIGFNNALGREAGNLDLVSQETSRNGDMASSSEVADGRFIRQTGQQVTKGSDKHM